MQFDSFSAFLAMGGYGFYVWLSFGVSAALILALIVSSIIGHKRVFKNIAIRQQRENKLRQVRKQRKNSSVDLNQDAPQESTKEIVQ